MPLIPTFSPRRREGLTASVSDQDFADRGFDGAHLRICRTVLFVGIESGDRLGGRFWVGAQTDARFATAGQTGERAAIPIAHRGVTVFIEAFALESFVVEFLDLREIEPEAQSPRRAPVGFAVDHDQISVAARGG